MAVAGVATAIPFVQLLFHKLKKIDEHIVKLA